nr:MAG TPA: hypothetical protein [Caudoviricetes sp.]
MRLYLSTHTSCSTWIGEVLSEVVDATTYIDSTSPWNIIIKYYIRCFSDLHR